MITLFGRRIPLFRPRSIWIRPVVQWAFFILIALISINHSLAERGGVRIPLVANASLHAVCPFGGVETLYRFVTTGTFVQKVHQSSFVLMIISFVLAILFGPAFCGWICPLGTIQELMSKLGRRLFRSRSIGPRFNHLVPAKLDRVLRYLRYGVLVFVLYMTARTAQLVFSNVDPYFALFNFWTSEASIAGLAILGATLLLSLVVERPWCKYACPYGAVLGITNLFRIFSIRRNESTCKHCSACSARCPMNIPVDSKTVVRDHQCISCLECTSEAVCPVAKTVQFATRGAK